MFGKMSYLYKIGSSDFLFLTMATILTLRIKSYIIYYKPRSKKV